MVRCAPAAAVAALLWAPAAHATEFLEARADAAVAAGPEHVHYDVMAGGALDTYVTGGVGARLGLLAGAYAFADETPEPIHAVAAPELGVWFGEDRDPSRWFAVVRPLLGVIDTSGSSPNALQRLELGAERGWRSDDGARRFRVGLFYAPTRSRDGEWRWLGLALRLSIALAPSAALPPLPALPTSPGVVPPPVDCLPGEPGC